jgi:hypothetical protein
MLPAALPRLGDRLGVERPNRRLLVIACDGYELIEDLALLGPGRGAVSATDYVGQFGPRRMCHLGAHGSSEVVEAIWCQWRTSVTSQVRQRPRPVTF